MMLTSLLTQIVESECLTLSFSVKPGVAGNGPLLLYNEFSSELQGVGIPQAVAILTNSTHSGCLGKCTNERMK